MPSGKRIFISYRRKQDAGLALLLATAIEREFGSGSVFLDKWSIHAGDDYRWVIERATHACDAMVVLIGTSWAPRRVSAAHLIGDPDFVRLEVATALTRGIPILPALLDGAALPDRQVLPPDNAGIADRQAIAIRREDPASAATAVVAGLRQMLGSVPPSALPVKWFEDLRPALKRTASPAEPAALLADFQETGSAHSRTAQQWCELGDRLAAAGFSNEARLCCEQAIRTGASDDGGLWAAMGHYGLAAINYEQGEYQSAVDDASRGIATLCAPEVSMVGAGAAAGIELIAPIEQEEPVGCRLARIDAAWAAYHCPSVRHVQVLGGLRLRLAEGTEAQGEVVGARYNFYYAMELATMAGDISSGIDAIKRVGDLERSTGNITRAEGWYRRALALAHDGGTPGDVARINLGIARCLKDRGDLAAAEALIVDCLNQLEREPTPELQADTLRDLAILHWRRGNLAEADTRHREVLELERKMRRLGKVASQLHNLAIIAQARGDLDRAEVQYREALTINERIGRKDGAAMQWMCLGLLHADRGDLASAEGELAIAESIYEALEQPRGLGQTLLNIGHLRELREDYVGAKESFRRSARLLDQAGEPADQAKAWLRLSRASMFDIQDAADVLVPAQEAYRRAAAAGDTVTKAEALFLIGVTHSALEDKPKARLALEEAVALLAKPAPSRAAEIRAVLEEL
jgi:tetratricopeptide (TPR) repeat protein